MSAVSISIDDLDEQGVTAQSPVGEVQTVEHVIDYIADPEQTVTNHRLLGVLGALVILFLVQAAFNLVLYLRRPDTIVVDRTAGGDRVVVMNNREYGLTDSVQFSPDRLSDGDKKYLASYFLNVDSTCKYNFEIGG